MLSAERSESDAGTEISRAPLLTIATDASSKQRKRADEFAAASQARVRGVGSLPTRAYRRGR